MDHPSLSRDGGIGRRAGLKIQYLRGCGGSIPPPGTRQFLKNLSTNQESCALLAYDI